MHKFQQVAGLVKFNGDVRINAIYRKAICKELGIDDLAGCIIEFNITVIHLKDNTRIQFE